MYILYFYPLSLLAMKNCSSYNIKKILKEKNEVIKTGLHALTNKIPLVFLSKSCPVRVNPLLLNSEIIFEMLKLFKNSILLLFIQLNFFLKKLSKDRNK